ncbi:paramyosin-like [Archocentrus centrarchus]|uniref:paramyosin-like n=1 Tax=Archocentrus centrarchus TaxID=63155 RepID=UPI0011E9D7E0|nr:paramyosin-like [Archocentrus centrarchus]
MSQDKFSTSTSVPEIREESATLYMSAESEITERMELQQRIRDLRLELRDVEAQNALYKASFRGVRDQLKEMLNTKVPKLEKLRETNQKEMDSLKEALDVFQREKQYGKVFKTMPEELSDARDEVTLLQSQLRKTEAENENLLAEVDTLQEKKKVLSQKNYCLTAELAHLQSVTEEKHEETGNLRQKISKLEDQVKEAEADKQAQVESVEAKMQTEIQTMKSSLSDLQVKAESLLHQKNCAVAELVQVESLGDEQRKEIAKLRRALGDSENQRAKAKNEIMMKEDELEKQKRVITGKQEEINDLKQKIFTLEDQVKEAEADKQAQVESVEAKMQTEIQTMKSSLSDLQVKAESLLHQKNCAVAELVQVESLGDEQRKEIAKLRRALGDSENQRAKAKNEIMMKEDELEKQKRVIADKQEEINDLNIEREIMRQITEDLKDQVSLLQEEKILAEECETDESEEMDVPVANLPPNTVQNSGSWFHGVTRLLKAGLVFAMTTLLISTAVLAASRFSPDCNFECGPVPF